MLALRCLNLIKRDTFWTLYIIIEEFWIGDPSSNFSRFSSLCANASWKKHESISHNLKVKEALNSLENGKYSGYLALDTHHYFYDHNKWGALMILIDYVTCDSTNVLKENETATISIWTCIVNRNVSTVVPSDLRQLTFI